MLQIYTIPAFNDNYFWLIRPDASQAGVYVVDPGAAQPVLATLHQHQLHLQAILLTHHHHDHVDGVPDLLAHHSVPVYGPSSLKMPQVTHPLREGDRVAIGPLQLRVMEIPGHTLDHIAYYLEDQGCLFSADTLFAAGCGRLFDGTAHQLYHSLQRIAALPDDTLVYAAHEYTLSNLRFARHIDPPNVDLIDREQQAQQTRAKGQPTVPMRLGLEKRTNPFLRCHDERIRATAESIVGHKLDNPADIFAVLRQAKDRF